MERETRPEPERPGWTLVRRFSDPRSALQVFETARDLLLSEDLEASAFRFLFGEQSFVALIGDETPAPPALARVHEALASGTPVGELPESILQELQGRRRAFKSTGAGFLERRTRFQPPNTTEDERT